MLTAKHVTPGARVWRHVPARAGHAARAQAALLLARHARPIGSLCCGLQQGLQAVK